MAVQKVHRFWTGVIVASYCVVLVAEVEMGEYVRGIGHRSSNSLLGWVRGLGADLSLSSSTVNDTGDCDTMVNWVMDGSYGAGTG